MGGIFVNTTSTKRLQDEPKATCNNADDMSLGTMKEEDSQIDQDLKFAAEQHIGCFIASRSVTITSLFASAIASTSTPTVATKAARFIITMNEARDYLGKFIASAPVSR